MEEKKVKPIKVGKLTISPKIVFALGLIGIVLIGLSGYLGVDDTTVKAEDYALQSKRYVEETEQRIQKILTMTSGVGKVTVMITIDNGTEYVYAKDEKQSGSTQQLSMESKYILIDGSTGKRQPLVLTQLEPKIKGVVVVCDGGNDPVVRQRVNDIVTTSLGISSLQVCILKLAP